MTKVTFIGFVSCMRKWSMRYSHILIKSYVPVEKQRNIIDSFPNPKNTVDRAYYQYKATMAGWTLVGRTLAEIASFFLLPFYCWSLRRKSVSFEEPFNLICLISQDQKNIIPLSLKMEFETFQYGDVSDQMCIDDSDWEYLEPIYKKYKGSYYFKLKILFRIAAYSAFIKRNHVKAFISAAEHSFSNTLCTDYCSYKCVENIVCQHGEYLKELSGSFFYVHRYYVWDKYYVTLHQMYRAFIPKFYVYLPDAISSLEIKSDEPPLYFATYYLEYETQVELASIRRSFDLLKKNGKTCKLRLHPRGRIYNEQIVKDTFGLDYNVEDCALVSLGDSISDSEYLIAVCSTVLLQGYLNGKKIIIDDITRKGMYESLKDRGYVMMSKPHYLLSDILSKGYKE